MVFKRSEWNDGGEKDFERECTESVCPPRGEGGAKEEKGGQSA